MDEKNGYMTLEGRSLLTEAKEFYREAWNWLGQYLERDFDKFTFDCRLESINSATALLLLNMFMKMDEHASDEKKVFINWITTRENQFMMDCGKEYREALNAAHFLIVAG